MCDSTLDKTKKCYYLCLKLTPSSLIVSVDLSFLYKCYIMCFSVYVWDWIHDHINENRLRITRYYIQSKCHCNDNSSSQKFKYEYAMDWKLCSITVHLFDFTVLEKKNETHGLYEAPSRPTRNYILSFRWKPQNLKSCL